MKYLYFRKHYLLLLRRNVPTVSLLSQPINQIRRTQFTYSYVMYGTEYGASVIQDTFSLSWKFYNGKTSLQFSIIVLK